MRLPLLAVCLLLVVSLGSGPAPGEPTPPRDQVVPEGIAGLTAAEIYELAVRAGQAGELARLEALLRAAARAGHENAALWLAELAFARGRADWPALVLEHLRPLAASAVLETQVFYWLGFAGEQARPPLAPAQVDLWYRIAAHDLVAGRGLTRADLQRRLDAYGEDWLNGGALSWRFRERVGEAWGAVRSGGGALVKQAEGYCRAQLPDAALLCERYLATADELQHPRGQFLYARHRLREGAGALPRAQQYFIAQSLCESGAAGVAEAYVLLAELIVARDFYDGHHRLPVLAHFLKRRELSQREIALTEALAADLSPEERNLLELHQNGRLPIPTCWTAP